MSQSHDCTTLARLAHRAATRGARRGALRRVLVLLRPALAVWLAAGAMLATFTFASTSFADLTPVNLALGQPATQSSTLYGSNASLAVDGNTDGNWNDGSVTYTNFDTNAWWQVDLGQSRRIGSIQIFNRTDCCIDSIEPFVVLVSDIPIIDNDIVASGAAAQPGIMRTEIDYIATQYSIPINRTGRYVRIALLGQNYLALAEVQVLEAFNAALGRSATQSSTLAAGTDASFAVDGFVDGLNATTKSEKNPWWQVDLGLPSMVDGINVWSASTGSTTPPGLYVFASPTPFTSDPMVTLPAGATKTFVNAQGAPAGVGLGIQAEFIRIVLNGTGMLSLAEVQVWPAARGAVGAHGTLSSTAYSLTNPNGATDLYAGAQGSDPTTQTQTDPYLELDLGGERYIDTLKVWGEALNSSSTTFSLFVSIDPFTSTTVAGTRAQPAVMEWVLRGTVDDVTVAVMQRARFIRVMLQGAGQRLSLSEVEIAAPEGYVTSLSNAQVTDNNGEGHDITFDGAYGQPNVTLDFYEYSPDAYATPDGFDDDYVWIGYAVSSSTPVTTVYSPFPVYPFSNLELQVDSSAWPLGGMGGFLVMAEDKGAPLRSFDFNPKYASGVGFSEPADESLFWPEIRVYDEGASDADFRGDHLAYLSLPMGNKANTSYYKLNASGSYLEIPTTYAAFKKQYFSSATTVNAKYYNNTDLGIGRNMTCAQPTWKANTTTVSGVVCAVDNFAPPSPAHSPAPVTFGDEVDTLPLITASKPAPFATVVMVQRTGATGAVFGVYDKNGNRIQSPAYLDSTASNTAVPNNCVSCHGGTAGTTVVDTARRFLLPFDPSGFAFETAHPYTLADQSEAFRKLNAIVLASNPSPAIVDFINGTYHGTVNTAGTVADPTYIPAGWSGSDGERKVFRTVIKPFCRNCHMSQLPASGGLDMLRAQDLEAVRALVVKDACVTHRMPQAQFPLKGMNDYGLQADLLGYFGRLDSAPGLDEMCAP